VRAPEDARQRPRRDRHGQEELSLDEAGVVALLGRAPASPLPRDGT